MKIKIIEILKKSEGWVDRSRTSTCIWAEDYGDIAEEIEKLFSLTSVKNSFSEAVDDIDSNGLECGIEDLGITDRYEAMQYGFEQCKERALEAIEITAD